MINPNFTRSVGDIDVTAGRGPGQLPWYERAGEMFRGKSVLDVGCGLGEGLKLLRKQCNAIGLDRDERLVEYIPDIVIGDIESVPDNSYDVVVAIDVIEHVDDDVSFCSHLRRVAKEGFFVTTPNAVASIVAWGKIWEFHPREYTPRELIDLLSPYGNVNLFKGKSSGTKMWSVAQPDAYMRLNDFTLNPATRLPARILGAPCRFVWNATVTVWPSGDHPSPRPSRKREGGESPSVVRVAGQKSHGRQPFGERRTARGRVKAKPCGWPSASLDAAATHRRSGRLPMDVTVDFHTKRRGAILGRLLPESKRVHSHLAAFVE